MLWLHPKSAYLSRLCRARIEVTSPPHTSIPSAHACWGLRDSDLISWAQGRLLLTSSAAAPEASSQGWTPASGRRAASRKSELARTLITEAARR